MSELVKMQHDTSIRVSTFVTNYIIPFVNCVMEESIVTDKNVTNTYRISTTTFENKKMEVHIGVLRVSTELAQSPTSYLPIILSFAKNNETKYDSMFTVGSAENVSYKSEKEKVVTFLRHNLYALNTDKIAITSAQQEQDVYIDNYIIDYIREKLPNYFTVVSFSVENISKNNLVVLHEYTIDVVIDDNEQDSTPHTIILRSKRTKEDFRLVLVFKDGSEQSLLNQYTDDIEETWAQYLYVHFPSIVPSQVTTKEEQKRLKLLLSSYATKNTHYMINNRKVHVSVYVTDIVFEILIHEGSLSAKKDSETKKLISSVFRYDEVTKEDSHAIQVLLNNTDNRTEELLANYLQYLADFKCTEQEYFSIVDILDIIKGFTIKVPTKTIVRKVPSTVDSMKTIFGIETVYYTIRENLWAKTVISNDM